MDYSISGFTILLLDIPKRFTPPSIELIFGSIKNFQKKLNHLVQILSLIYKFPTLFTPRPKQEFIKAFKMINPRRLSTE